MFRFRQLALLCTQRSHRERWLLWDPSGMLIAGFAWTIMILAFCAIWMSISYWTGIFTLVGAVDGFVLSACLGICMWCHWMTMTTNPGTLPSPFQKSTNYDVDTTTNDDDSGEEFVEEEIEMPLHEVENRQDDGSLFIFCDECNIYRPPRAVHCDTCGTCIVLMDHHCPWVNNCVGIGNQKYFLLFLFYVSVTSMHVILLIVVQRWTCNRGQAFCGFATDQFPGRIGIWMLAAGCVFGIFCIVMLTMEIFSIDEDPFFTTIAEQLHSRTGCKSRSRVERHLSVIFGTNGFDLTWFLPMPNNRRSSEEAIVMGMCGSKIWRGDLKPVSI